MTWKNPRENRTELFILLGMVIILIGFIEKINLSGGELILGGTLVLGIGIYRFFKDLGKNRNKFFIWKKK